jgi:hypothetical protein
MKKILVGLVLLCCGGVALAEENELLVGAIQHLNPTTFCKSVDDANALAELYATDTEKAHAFFLTKNAEAKCNIHPATFTVIDEVKVHSGQNGLVHVVEVEALNARHFIITNKSVRKFVPHMTVGTEYFSEVPYCNVEDEAQLLATSVATDLTEANTLLQTQRDAGFCNMGTIQFSVLEDMSPLAERGAVHVVKVRAGNGIHYILTSLEVRERPMQGFPRTVDASVTQEETLDAK